jgi:hypothetical protein
MRKLLLFFLLIVGCAVGLMLASRAPGAVTVSVIGRSTNAAGAPTVVFQITNYTSSSFVVSFGTQVSSNGPVMWFPPRSQMKDFRFGQKLPGNSSTDFEFTTPAEGAPWRAYALYSWPPGSIRARVDNFLKKYKLAKRKIVVSPQIDK